MNDNNEHDFYANAVNVVTGIYDVTLHFTIQSPVSMKKGEQPVIEVSRICNVRMSPQLAKALATLLVKQVVDYENANKVELPVPPNIQELWNSVRKG